MANRLNVPSPIHSLARQCIDQNGRLLIVGGGVRDHLLGTTPKDWDIEVFGLSFDHLSNLLNQKGGSHAVGKSFSIFKWACDGQVYDVAIPRRNSVSNGIIEVIGDPSLTLKEAAKRRDLTINAISYDPLLDEFIDPFDGHIDLKKRLLRPVHKATFLEDPLRVLRAAQLMARFEFKSTPLLLECVTEAQLTHLPSERLQGEFFKLFCTSIKPSLGLHLLIRATGYTHLFPGLTAPNQQILDGVDELATVPFSSSAHKWSSMLTVWLSDTPTPTVNMILDRLGIYTLTGLDIRKQVLSSLRLSPTLRLDDAVLNHLSTEVDLEVLTRVGRALHPKKHLGDACRQRSAALGILHTSPDPLCKGRHLQELGMRPGPEMGVLLKEVYTAQLNGAVQSLPEAKTLALQLIRAS